MDIRELLIKLTEIPAPTGKEQKRARFIAEYLKRCGYEPFFDKAGNVLVHITFSEKADDKFTLFSAHLDTVFDDEVINVVQENNILSAPGIGDDTSNVVFLMKVLDEIKATGRKPKSNLLFAFNVGEEGLGNLKGMRQIMDDYQGRISTVIAFDLMSDSICCKAVGSKRYEVNITSKGGHSYHDFGRRGAIEAAAVMISRIYEIKAGNDGNSIATYNVGLINGGTSVNTIAQNCSFTAEVRSDSKLRLQNIDEQLTRIFKMYDGENDIDVVYKLIGDRPTDGDIPKGNMNILIDKVSQIIYNKTGIKPELKAGSTDCNIPLSYGIPAISFGGYKGGGTHTRQEWIDTSFLDKGYRMIMDCVEQYLE